MITAKPEVGWMVNPCKLPSNATALLFVCHCFGIGEMELGKVLHRFAPKERTSKHDLPKTLSRTMSEMRKGEAPNIRRGATYRGDQLSVDHIIPRSVCPELDNAIADLELMPMRANASKRAKIGSHQVQKAEELHQAGLLNKEGLFKVQAAPQ